MAKQKPTSRAAARSAAQKKSPARKTAAKSTSRKQIKSKARAAPAAKRARPKQRIAISHHRDEDFKADGLRAYAQYRDLGIAEASRGLARAHVIQFSAPTGVAGARGHRFEIRRAHFSESGSSAPGHP